MKIKENEVNIIPALLELIGTGRDMDVDFMAEFESILNLRGIEPQTAAELNDCVDAFAETGVVEIYKEAKQYKIRKSNG